MIHHHSLIDLLNMDGQETLAEKYKILIEESLQELNQKRNRKWTQSTAVGDLAFIENVKDQLGFSLIGRKPVESHGSYHLQEEKAAYGLEQEPELAMENTFMWNAISASNS